MVILYESSRELLTCKLNINNGEIEMDRKYLTKLVKNYYKHVNQEYQNRLIICSTVLEAAKVAEYLTKYDVGEVVLNKFKNKSNDKYVEKVLRLHANVNADKPRGDFEEFLALYANNRYVFGYTQADVDQLLAPFAHISFYEECCIAVLKPQYNYNDWCRDFEREYYKTHPRN